MNNPSSNWRTNEHDCRACNWHGAGSALALGDFTADYQVLECPACGQTMAFVMNQTTEETRANWDNLSEAERKQLEERERFLANFSERKLRASSQLPDIESTSFKLRWDFAETELGSETLLMSGDKVVFREPALFEGYERFIEVAEILRARYGTALRDLVPTKGSEIYLYGDRSTSPDTVAKARRRIFFSRTKN